MEKRTREKIALVVFGLLVVFAGAVLIGYFATGRSWNVAASFVDDTVGNMDGYLAIVYPGVVPEDEPADAKTADGEAGGSAEGADTAGGEADADSADDVGDGVAVRDAAAGVDGSGSGSADGTGDTADARDSSAAASSDASAAAGGTSSGETSSDGAMAGGSSGSASSSDDAAPDDGSADVSAGGLSIGLDILSLLSRSNAGVDKAVFVSDVRDLYERKGADVLTLDPANLDRYLDPQVLTIGDRRVGVFAVQVYASHVRLDEVRSFFEEQGVDVVVCLTPRADYLSSMTGIDDVIVTSDFESISTEGEFRGGTFVIASPAEGQVGVVLVTSSNVSSARVVDGL